MLTEFDKTKADNFEYVLSRVKKQGWDLYNASSRLKNNAVIVKVAVMDSPHSFKYAGFQIKSNKENLKLIKYAVKKRAENYFELSSTMQDDKKLLLGFVSSNYLLYRILPEDKKQDEDVKYYAFHKFMLKNFSKGSPVEFFDSIKHDEESKVLLNKILSTKEEDYILSLIKKKIDLPNDQFTGTQILNVLPVLFAQLKDETINVLKGVYDSHILNEAIQEEISRRSILSVKLNSLANKPVKKMRMI